MGCRIALLLAVALLGFQQDPGTLVEKLRSDRIEDREEATRTLRRAGAEVVPLLERAMKDPDPEMAARAGGILRLRRVLAGLTPRFRRLMPGAQERLIVGHDSVYADLFLEATGRESPAAFGRDDLSVLAGPAVLGAQTAEAKSRVFHEAVRLDLHEAVPAIEGFLDDRDPRVRLEAIQALAGLHAEGSAGRLLAALGDPHDEVRGRAARALSDLGIVRAAPQICRLLEDPSDYTRWNAAHSLLELRHPGALTCARRFAAAEDEKEAALGIWMLEALAPEEAVAPLARLARKSSREGSDAVELLGRRGATAEFRELLKEKKPGIRETLIHAIVQFSVEGLGPDLCRLLVDEDPEVRHAAIHSMGPLHVREAIPDLLPLLESTDEDLRHAAVSSLAELGVREIVPTLRSWLDTEHPGEYRRSAAGALRELGALEAAPELRTLLEDPDGDLQELGITVLARLGDREAIPRLLELLDDPRPSISAAALLALGCLDAHGAAPAIARFLRPDPAHLYQAAIWTLGRLGIPEHAARIFDLARNPEVPVPWPLHAPLRQLGMGDRIDLLRDLLRDKKVEGRRRGMELVSIFDRDASAPLVVPLLEDPDPWVRRSAAGFLCDAGRREGLEPSLRSYYLPMSLNRFREPELWKRLEETRLSPVPRGTPPRVAREVARRLGVRLDWELLPELPSRPVCGLRGGGIDLPVSDPRDTPLEILQGVLPYDTTILLEDDRIRVLPQARADIFWRRWWDVEERRSR
jgi:HEAT repeat protein